MRIAYITYEYPPDISAGGIATYVHEASRMMLAQGIEVEVFAGSYSRSGVFQEDGVLIHRVRVSDVNDFAARVAEVFAIRHSAAPFNLYETPEINANAAIIYERFPNLPFVTKLHMPVSLQLKLYQFYYPFLKKLRYVIGSLMRGRWDAGYWRTYDPRPELDKDYNMTVKAAAVTAPSEAMKQWACRYWRIHPSRITVMENPYTPSQQFLEQVYDFENRSYLCFIGKLNVHKGMVAFTKALPAILTSNPDLKIMLIGNDGASHIEGVTMQTYMAQQLKEFSNRIFFTGAVPFNQISSYLQQAKACIFPSIWEAFGYVALEAMSAGVPVLASKGSGFEEVLDYGRYGVLFDALDANEMAMAANKLLQNKQHCCELSKLGRNRVSFYARNSALAQKHLLLYQEVISKSL